MNLAIFCAIGAGSKYMNAHSHHKFAIGCSCNFSCGGFSGGTKYEYSLHQKKLKHFSNICVVAIGIVLER
eukprot:5214171-Amphidinium_carterae.1